MIKDKEYGLVSGWEELQILRRLDKSMRVHRCAEIGCRELIKLGWDYCDKHYQQRMNKYVKMSNANREQYAKTLRGQAKTAEHARDYDATRRQELHSGFYNSKQWNKVSDYVKHRDGYSDAINGMLWSKGDLIVDHIVPRRLLPAEKQLDKDNLWLLTREQHNHKTSVENKLNENVLKHAKREWWIKVLSK